MVTRIPERTCPARRPHSWRSKRTLVASGQGRWNVQVRRRTAQIVSGQRRHPRQGNPDLLQNWREGIIHLVRAEISPRLPKREELRRIMDRMGQHGTHPNSETLPLPICLSLSPAFALTEVERSSQNPRYSWARIPPGPPHAEPWPSAPV